jgi:agmatine deiminase
MPAEWEPHEATWLAWPHEKSDWPGKFGPIPWVYAEIVRHLHVCERVRILVHDSGSEHRARRVLGKAGIDFAKIDFFHVPSNRSWIRDSGPIFIKSVDGHVGLTAWGFNAWAKYPQYDQDARIPEQIQRAIGLPLWKPAVHGRHIILEGGSIDANGHGLLLTTEECLLSSVQSRNPGFDQVAWEHVLRDFLGIAKVLWLSCGIVGDDTHGHVDDIARFVGPKMVVAATESRYQDPNFEPLRRNRERLNEMTDVAGRRLEIVELPMPDPVYFAGVRLPASYLNFYIANDRVLVPTFNDPKDSQALGILAEIFAGRRVIGIHCLDLVWGLGTIHCATQQQPKATP